MITLTDRWSVTRDAYQWVLVETYKTGPKAKHPTATRESYHPWLSDALRWAAEKDCENAESLLEIEGWYNALVVAFHTSINLPDRSALELHAKLRDVEKRLTEANRRIREFEKERRVA